MKKLFLLIFLFSLVFSALAQDQKKPKIGVVLSGGGAKGLAHIGVLKVLEEAGIKVDYIGGTSMGAIVGGLYASGYSAKQLDSIFSAIDSDALLQDYIPRTSKSFFEKRNDEVYALTLPFNKFRIGVPTALSKGLYNFNLLTRLTHHVRHVRDFSQLTIPFVCIATDIENGEKIVLKSGVLPQAILASGAFPSLYTPVEINGRLLIDGGVTDNYPIEEVRKMGADIIIGVDVQDGLKDRETIGGASGVLVQITNFGMIERMAEKRKQTDIYIKPDIKKFSVISFDQGREIIRKGEDAAFAVYEALEKLGYGQQNPHIKRGALPSDLLEIEDVRVNNLKNFTRPYVLGKLKIKNSSKVTYKKLDAGVGNLNSTQNFSSISYHFEETAGGDELVMELKENPVTRFLRFGLHYDDLYKSAALINITQRKVFFKNDNISADFILGDNLRYNLNYYFDNGFYWSFGVSSRYNTFNKNIATDFSNGVQISNLGVESINIDFSDLTNQLFAQTVFVQKYLIGAGIEHKHLKIKSETLQNNNPVLERSDYLAFYGYMKFDSQDKNYFPKKGFHFFGDFKSLVYSSDYTRQFQPFSIAKADMQFVQTFFRKISLRLQSEGGFVIGERTIPFYDFVLGGYGYNMTNNFRHFYGYDFLSISGNSYVKGEIGLDWEFYKKNHFNMIANYANVGNNIFQRDSWISRPTYSGYAIGYGMETLVGPIEIKHSWSPETRNHYTWFSVGYSF